MLSYRSTIWLLLVGSLALSFPVIGSSHYSQPSLQETQADNTKQNKDQPSPTADQQKDNTSDREITRRIRKSVMADKSLSTYAHNVKIISENGKVTLRGPVKSEDEKSSVEAKAAAVVGEGNVTCLIKVVPSK